MANTPTLNENLELIARSGLLQSAVLDTYRDVPPDDVYERMQNDGVLTPFQIRQLQANKYRGFFVGDKYKIVDFLGKGGMGRVVLCEHLILQRLVAVKIMDPGMERVRGAAERFLREARAAAAVDHANLARIYDVDRTPKGLYMVMEYIDGMDLQEFVHQHGALEPLRAANYMHQAATGLQRAHMAGLVHRDIKPSNLMLDRFGTVKVLDLGLARFFDSEHASGLTTDGAVLGTADFIAPEQALSANRADIRADIYSLGCAFYVLLVRRLPAGSGSTVQKLLRHQSVEPESIRTIRPEVPEELVAVVERMMKKRPEDRYQTPAEVIEALAPFVKEPIAPPSASEMPPQRLQGYKFGLTSLKAAAASQQQHTELERSSLSFTATKSQENIAGDTPADDRKRSPTPSQVRTSGKKRSSSAGPANQPTPAQPVHRKPAATTPTPANAANGQAQPAVAQETLAQVANPGAAVPPNIAQGVQQAVLANESVIAQPHAQVPHPMESVGTYQKWRRELEKRPILVMSGILVIASLVLGVLFFPSGGNHATTVALAPVDPNEAKRELLEKADPLSKLKLEGALSKGAAQAPMIVVRGGGSTFIKPMMERWSEIYEGETGRQVEYTGAGSTKGVEGLLARFLDFACSDAPLTEKQIEEAGSKMLHVPLVMGAVVPTYNVTDSRGESLKLRFTGALLANIYLGKVKNWNDPALVANNPGIDLPDLPITVVARKDGSGTTNIWTDYLAKSSAAWMSQIGVGSKVTWPVGVVADKNNGVADAVSRTNGAIGYVEYSYALANGLSVGEIKNREGNFVKASVESITAAAAESLHNIPDDFRYSLTDAPGRNSYPVVGTGWAIVFVDQPPEKGADLLRFLQWAIRDGQQYASELNYAPLPGPLVERIRAALNEIKHR